MCETVVKGFVIIDRFCKKSVGLPLLYEMAPILAAISAGVLDSLVSD